VTLMQIAPLATADKLVTDDNIPPEAVSAIEAEGVEVITAARLGPEVIPAAAEMREVAA